MTTPQPPISNIQLSTLMPIECSQISHLNPMLWSLQKIGGVKRRVEEVDVNISLKELDEKIIPNIQPPSSTYTFVVTPMCPPHKKNNAPHNLDQRGNHNILDKERKKVRDEYKNPRFESHNNAICRPNKYMEE